MRRQLIAVVIFSAVFAGGSARAESWIFQPSTYSHDPHSGERVDRYAGKAPAYARTDPSYERSAYIHKRTAIRGAAGSIERRHYVETWGAGEAIRPYGEWQRPFRAGATPYGPWGNPNGPWTTPYDSWVNPYGLGRLPTPPWSPWYPPQGYVEPGYPGYGAPSTGAPQGDHHGKGGPPQHGSASPKGGMGHQTYGPAPTNQAVAPAPNAAGASSAPRP